MDNKKLKKLFKNNKFKILFPVLLIVLLIVIKFNFTKDARKLGRALGRSVKNKQIKNDMTKRSE